MVCRDAGAACDSLITIEFVGSLKVIMSEMDKSWMHSDRRSKAYEFGWKHFELCCRKSSNYNTYPLSMDHVYFNGIDQSYKNWTFHGEPWEATTNASRNVEEDDGHSRYSFVSEEIDMDDNDFGDFGSDPYEFALRAALMWTINDFPAYENLSGCVVKGYKACPICGDDTPSHRHALDVMHIEKNVCDSIIGTLLEIPGKNKDGIAARLDLLNMGVKTDLQPKYGERRTRLPPGPWNLSRVEKREIQDFLALNHNDCHTLMQQLLPVAIRSVLEKPAIHLVREVRLCGPVYFTWMYPFERYMKVLKGYVQNVLIPKVALLSGWSAFSEKMGVSKPLSGCTVSVVDQDLLNQAHLYALENTEEVLPYIEYATYDPHQDCLSKFRKRTKWLQDKHNSTFIQWLHFKVQSELEEDNHGVSENLRWLAAGPNMAVPLYRSYLIKGIKFNIKAQDDVRTTQNSGVYLLAHTMQVANAKDKNPILSNMGFYGVIQEIWDLDYQKFTIPVFRCDWIDSSGLVVDKLGFTLVDLSKIGHRNDQFVLASQVKQIFLLTTRCSWLVGSVINA
ncbi:hypothetical protein Prudu_001807 [Prunus dulcis]|uniref:Transposable element protein n=1 Tax=Prunus dulcis TaxID=3755 RepID=A0A4Y1QPB3_PRUDU|nr:hypothetical protein Prudu_001807 [Prunus dulcis]